MLGIFDNRHLDFSSGYLNLFFDGKTFVAYRRKSLFCFVYNKNKIFKQEGKNETLFEECRRCNKGR